MPKVTLYHNPRCSKSRQTLALLRENDIEPTIIEYLKTPPSQSELKNILKHLDMSARDLLRKKEAAYKEENLADESLSEAAIIKKMVNHPSLIERPIVVIGKKARIGRPPEAVLEIL